jgi:carboxyl-terminal processing protease
VAGIFLPTGTIVGHLVRRGESLKILRAAGTPLLLWPHIVVLTNAETASSSEVVASGLLGAHRATVVGERSAGIVGLARAVPLPSGGMRVTVYRVTGARSERLDGVGIVPQIRVPLTTADMERSVDPPLQTALRISDGSLRSGPTP